jgi:hypothetical protein
VRDAAPGSVETYIEFGNEALTQARPQLPGSPSFLVRPSVTSLLGAAGRSLRVPRGCGKSDNRDKRALAGADARTATLQVLLHPDRAVSVIEQEPHNCGQVRGRSGADDAPIANMPTLATNFGMSAPEHAHYRGADERYFPS